MLPPGIPWKWIGIGLGALLIVATVFFSIRAYGNARYDAGVSDTDAKWIEAGRIVEENNRAAAAAADDGAEEREQGFAEALQEEKEKLDEAAANDDDPFDILFDAFSVRDDEITEPATP